MPCAALLKIRHRIQKMKTCGENCMCYDKSMKKKPEKFTLGQTIVGLLILGWILPVLIMTTLLATFVDRRGAEQVDQTVFSAMDKAEEIFRLEMDACETASKNASYYSDIRDAYLECVRTGDDRSFSAEVNGFLRSEYKYNSLIRCAVLIFPKENDRFYTYNNSTGAGYGNVEYFLGNVEEEVRELAESLGTSTTLMSENGHTYMVRNLMLPDFTPYAVLALELNEQMLVSGYESVWGYTDSVFLLDGAYMTGNAAVAEGAGGKPDRGRSYVTRTLQVYNREITVIVSLDRSVLYEKRLANWLIFGILIIVMFPLMFLLFRFFDRSVLLPIGRMVHAYGEVAGKNYGYRIEEHSASREFYYMEQSFNEMSAQIRDQFDRIYREEIALRDARIMALQSQINPHFLNNTFEIINWEARLNGNIKVSKMIEALSTMLEATMNRRGDPLHSLSEELNYVDAYAYIISERLGDDFHYGKEVDESLLGVHVPKLILQPIVENAVEHGLSRVHKGNVRLRLFAEGDYILIEIVNDGAMNEEDEQKVRRILSEAPEQEQEGSLSLGIRNVNRRLRLIYGPECGLFMENRDGCYTVSTIRLKKTAAQ